MSGGPVGRVDLAMVGMAATAAGLDNAVRLAAARLPAAERGAAVRFIDQEVASFIWNGSAVYLTPADVVALFSAAILLIRFLVWALAPLARYLWGAFRGRKEKSKV